MNKNTNLINYAEKMAELLRRSEGYEPYHNDEIAMVVEELVKNLLNYEIEASN